MIEREFTIEADGKRFDFSLQERCTPAIDVPAAGAGGTPASGGGQSRPSGAGSLSDDGDSGGGVQADGEVVTAEMPGPVLDVNVAEGDEMAAGDVLFVLEAMKMENDIVSEFEGTVAELAVQEGQPVDMGETLDVID